MVVRVVVVVVVGDDSVIVVGAPVMVVFLYGRMWSRFNPLGVIRIQHETPIIYSFARGHQAAQKREGALAFSGAAFD